MQVLVLVLVLVLVGGVGAAGGDDVVAEVWAVLLVVLMWVVVLLRNTDAFCQWGLDQTMESTAAAWTTARQLQVLVAAWWRVDNVLLSAAAWIVLASDLCAARIEAFDWVSWLPSAPPVW